MFFWGGDTEYIHNTPKDNYRKLALCLTNTIPIHKFPPPSLKKIQPWPFSVFLFTSTGTGVKQYPCQPQEEETKQFSSHVSTHIIMLQFISYTVH